MTMRRVTVPGASLEVDDRGHGDPVLLVQTALTADELVPVARHPAVAAHHRTIVTHRRGYAGSSAAEGPGSVARDAADCSAVLEALGVPRAHLVGVSYSAGVCLQVAADRPSSAHTLTLMEPPPVLTSSTAEFRAANDQLLDVRRDHGLQAALDRFMTTVVGPDWRVVVDELLPGAVSQIRRDAATFFDVDIPALLAWRFDQRDAGVIRCPVLHVAGSDSGPWFAEVRRVMLDWFPEAGDVVIAGADHSLPLTHVAEVAEAVAAFLRSHPMGEA